jgi:hypothetical protein
MVIFFILFFFILLISIIVGIFIYFRKSKIINTLNAQKNIIPIKCPVGVGTLVVPCIKRGYCFLPDELAMYSTICDETIDDCGNGKGKPDGTKPKMINGRKMWFRQANFDPSCKEIEPNAQLAIVKEINN